MNKEIKQSVSKLFEDTFQEKIQIIEKLPISGSSRSYYRVKGEKYKVVATINDDVKENEAFLYLSKHFKEQNINVPQIFSVNKERTVYLQEDLGDETLYERTKRFREKDNFPEEVLNFYKKALEQLADIQINGRNNIDYSVCYPREAFDDQSILWDLNYFKYNFLKLTGVKFDEQLLENDFNSFINYLLKTETDYFLYRDFKSLNIMVHEDELYFIDYQGGRKGALQYDVASILNEATADIPSKIKAELLDHYINYVGTVIKINKDDFKDYYHAYTLVRILQAMGTYGYRGLYEKKQHYIDSIPLRLKSLNEIIKDVKILDSLPELKRVLSKLTNIDLIKPIKNRNKLTVTIKSFSYRKGIPIDLSGNGGGFVFDCRFLNNPGRIEKYKTLCGKDIEVIEFLEKDIEVQNYLESIKQIMGSSLKSFITRDFKHMAVNFGCTGGQHRSVFFAEQISEFIMNNYDIHVDLEHTQGF